MEGAASQQNEYERLTGPLHDVTLSTLPPPTPRHLKAFKQSGLFPHSTIKIKKSIQVNMGMYVLLYSHR